MRVRTADGVEVAVHDLGGQGRPVLFVHATGFHGRLWEPVAAHLAEVFHCWSLDLRAHGDSGLPPAFDTGWNQFALDVLATVDGLGLDRPLAVGHSLGATSLLLAEEDRPGTFEAMYLFEPALTSPDEAMLRSAPGRPNPMAEGTRKRREVFPSFEAAIENFSSKPPMDVFTPEAMRLYVEHGFEPLPDGTVRIKCRAASEAEIYANVLNHDAFERLDLVRCPVVLGQGDSSGSVRTERAEAMADVLAQVRMAVLPGLGHFAPMEAPARVAAAVADAFAGCAHAPARNSMQ